MRNLKSISSLAFMAALTLCVSTLTGCAQAKDVWLTEPPKDQSGFNPQGEVTLAVAEDPNPANPKPTLQLATDQVMEKDIWGERDFFHKKGSLQSTLLTAKNSHKDYNAYFVKANGRTYRIKMDKSIDNPSDQEMTVELGERSDLPLDTGHEIQSERTLTPGPTFNNGDKRQATVTRGFNASIGEFEYGHYKNTTTQIGDNVDDLDGWAFFLPTGTYTNDEYVMFKGGGFKNYGDSKPRVNHRPPNLLASLVPDTNTLSDRTVFDINGYKFVIMETRDLSYSTKYVRYEWQISNTYTESAQWSENQYWYIVLDGIVIPVLFEDDSSVVVPYGQTPIRVHSNKFRKPVYVVPSTDGAPSAVIPGRRRREEAPVVTPAPANEPSAVIPGRRHREEAPAVTPAPATEPSAVIPGRRRRSEPETVTPTPAPSEPQVTPGSSDDNSSLAPRRRHRRNTEATSSDSNGGPSAVIPGRRRD